MTGISTRLGTKTRIFAAAAAAAAAVGLTACSAAGGAPAPTVTKTVAQNAPASQAPAASDSTAKAHQGSAKGSGGTSAAAPAADTSAHGKLPKYRPSALVSKSASSTVLTSPDSVSKIGSFYRKALAAGGWHVVSDSASPYHTSFSADRGNEGVNISVYPRGSGSGISISTHPR